ncbi:MAG: PD-(D/E)XK nuclease family protein [Flavobacteriales bacterium]|nr:PD-(D/E)XK nuclease family protein [Flavobacteriales bacterium]MCB9194351.1 PD-(D/E)XK nuclease family protein [Flavobacteriales bacterium]
MIFLRELADLLLQDHGSALRDIAVVLPSRRAGLHLRQHLALLHRGPLWSPQVHTLDTFLTALAGLEQLDSLATLLELHQVHLELRGEKADPLEHFLQWGPTALRDMNDVDQHLLDHAIIYRDLRNLEEIDAWSYRSGELSKGQKDLAERWAHHAQLHERLLETLFRKGLGTTGQIARIAADKALDPASFGRWDRVHFAGLNALTPAQLKVVRSLCDAGRADVAWDADRYYLEHELQEAGRFLRADIAALGAGRIPAQDMVRGDPPQVRVVRAPGRMVQVWTAIGELLNASPDEREDTCIILSDEQLLPPLLSALPEELGPVNVTMGLALADMPIGDLLHAFLQLHTAPGSRAARENALSHLLGHAIWGHAGTRVENALGMLRMARGGRIPPDVLRQGPEGDPVADHLSAALVDVRHAGQLRDRIHHLLRAAKEARPDPVMEEQLFRTALVIDRLDALLQVEDRPMTVAAYSEVLLRLFREARIDLYGEPLEGIQVMGLLESRAMDHAHFIILGAEEGHLPGAGIENSFIPWDIRRAYGLPLGDDSQAVSAYPVFRLLHHARKITLVHGDSGEEAGGPSRYLQQWAHELPRAAATQLQSVDVRIPIRKRHDAHIALRKGPQELDALRARCESGWSPTALSTWLTCPLDHYFKYVLGLQETPSRADRLGHDELGRVVHGVLEQMHRALMGQWVTPADLEHLRRSLPDLLDERSRALDIPIDLSTGAAFLQMTMARQALDAHLEQLHKRVSKGERLRILAAETEIAAELPTAFHGLDHPVHLKGRIDLIEERDGVSRLVDMKTGHVDPSELKVAFADPEPLDKLTDKSLQLIIYSWLYLTTVAEAGPISACIVPLRARSMLDGLPLVVDGGMLLGNEFLPRAGALLGRLVRRMMDPDVPIAHRAESRYCRFCAEGQ